MTHPNRKHFSIEIEGVTYPLRFEMADWALAEQKLSAAKIPNAKLFPFLQTPFWVEYIEASATGQDALLHGMIFLFVGLQSAIPGLTWDQMAEMINLDVTSMSMSGLLEALADFFHRLGFRKETPETQTPSENPTPEPQPGSDSAPIAESN